MTITVILTDKVLVKSVKTATIHAPIERVNIADWLLHLPDAWFRQHLNRGADSDAAGAALDQVKGWRQ